MTDVRSSQISFRWNTNRMLLLLVKGCYCACNSSSTDMEMYGIIISVYLAFSRVLMKAESSRPWHTRTEHTWQWNVLLLAGGGDVGSWTHEMATSSQCQQLWTPHPLWLHSPRDDSLPEHRTLSNQICPEPAPNVFSVIWPTNLQWHNRVWRRTR